MMRVEDITGLKALQYPVLVSRACVCVDSSIWLSVVSGVVGLLNGKGGVWQRTVVKVQIVLFW